MRPEQLVSDLLRLLTPEEILKLTTISRGEVKHNLTELISKRMDDIEHLEDDSAAFEEKEGSTLLDSFRVKAEEENEVEEALSRRTDPVPVDQKGVVFFLDIKRKTRKSQKILKQKEVISLYQENAAIDIDQEKACHEDLNKSVFKGVLINKKQS